MPFSIKSSVGSGCKNLKPDVEAVQEQLNKYIFANRLGPVGLLTVNGSIGGGSGATIKAIKEFQKRVCGFNTGDGKISPDGQTATALANDPALHPQQALLAGYALKSLAFGAPPGIPSDLWTVAMKNLLAHSADIRLSRGHLATLVDFRKINTEPRLWLADIHSHIVLREELAGHGRGSTGSGASSWSTIFSNVAKSNASCVGGFVALNTWASELGGQKGTALALDGLDKSNSAARTRGIRFHGATYVKPGKVGCSHGCFVTMPSVNEHLVKVISGGSFVYAYGGEYWES